MNSSFRKCGTNVKQTGNVRVVMLRAGQYNDDNSDNVTETDAH